jgi:hypothetical protein
LDNEPKEGRWATSALSLFALSQRERGDLFEGLISCTTML